jgi:hypothetical protein
VPEHDVVVTDVGKEVVIATGCRGGGAPPPCIKGRMLSPDAEKVMSLSLM